MLPTRCVVQYHRRVRNQVFFRNLAGFSDFWDVLDKGTVPDRLNQSGLPTVRYSSTRSLSRPTVPDDHHVILSYPFLHRLERFHTKLQKPSLFPRFFFQQTRHPLLFSASSLQHLHSSHIHLLSPGSSQSRTHHPQIRRLRLHLRLLALRVLHRLIDRQNGARSLARRGHRVDFGGERLPDALLQRIADGFPIDVHAHPARLRVMQVPQLVQDLRGGESCVVAQLSRDHFQATRHAFHDELQFPFDRLRFAPQHRGDRHLHRAAAAHDAIAVNALLGHHQRVYLSASSYQKRTVDRSLRFLQELLRTAAQQERRRRRPRAVREQIVPLAPHLHFLERAAAPQHRRRQSVHRRLDLGARGALQSLHVAVRNAARAEHAAVREVLRGQVADREAREHDIGARSDAGVQFLVDQTPLRVHNALILRRTDPDLCQNGETGVPPRCHARS